MKQRIPRIIQGGMGLGVSQWQLAREVSLTGQLGVVSLTAAPVIVGRLLQDGDPGGHLRRAFDHFPVPEVAERIWQEYYRPGGRKGVPYVRMPSASLNPLKEHEEFGALSCFAEIWLAKEGHDGQVGLNMLEKVQLTHPASVFGAILAGVDVVIVGAGIPDQFPAMLTSLSRYEPFAYKVTVRGASMGDEHQLPYDPRRSFGTLTQTLKRPEFLAIVSSNLLANFLDDADKKGELAGFVVEEPTAGGHNAPPRGKQKLNERGEPIYGPRDAVDFAKLRALGRPFWSAGSYVRPERVKQAREQGAVGLQAGSIFALTEESGFRDDLKQQARKLAYHGQLDVFTDPVLSPSGFPFKVARVPGTLADKAVFESRDRVCNIGGFKEPYVKKDGTVGYRCPAEPLDVWRFYGGEDEETVGRMCLCNALMAVVGLGQSYPSGYEEPALMTMGDDTSFIRSLMAHEGDTWTARQAVAYLEKLMLEAGFDMGA